MSGEVLGVVRETLQPAHAIRRGCASRRPGGASPGWSGHGRLRAVRGAVPVRHDNDVRRSRGEGCATSSSSWSAGGLWGGIVASSGRVFTDPAAGWLLAARRPDSPIGWLLLVIGASWGFSATATYADYTVKLHHDLAGGPAPADPGKRVLVAGRRDHGDVPPAALPGRAPARARAGGGTSRWTSAVAMVVGVMGLTTSSTRTPWGMPVGSGRRSTPRRRRPRYRCLDVSWVAIFVVVVMMVASAASLVVRYLARPRAGTTAGEVARGCGRRGGSRSTRVVVPVGALVDPSSQDTPAWLSAAQTASLLQLRSDPRCHRLRACSATASTRST